MKSPIVSQPTNKIISKPESKPRNRPTHVVTGNVFEALGFSASAASALKIKAEILSAILEHVRAKRYTQAQLVELLDEHQPSVSNLLRGRIAQLSIEKLLRYADLLHLETSVRVSPKTPAAIATGTNRPLAARRLAVAV